jgi:hypothetical protein
MDIDEILINLGVLSKVQANQKLITRDKYLNIEYVSIIPEFIRRWKRQDNRDETIKKITLVVHSAIDFLKNKKEGEYITTSLNENSDNTLNNKKKGYDIKIYLKNSISGLKALKETYGTCCQTCSRIDVLIDKIEKCLNDF